MTGNNSCGARSIHYGTMRDNVQAVDAILADGSHLHFGELPEDRSALTPGYRALADRLLALRAQEAEEISLRFPRLIRRVGGYNIDALTPQRRNAQAGTGHTLAPLRVGLQGHHHRPPPYH